MTARLENGGLRVLAGRCPNLLEEAGLYRYGDGQNQTAETPVDEHNHALAALRYLISGLDRWKMARQRTDRGGEAPVGNEGKESKQRKPPTIWEQMKMPWLWTEL